jgi:hypothetical protein
MTNFGKCQFSHYLKAGFSDCDFDADITDFSSSRFRGDQVKFDNSTFSSALITFAKCFFTRDIEECTFHSVRWGDIDHPKDRERRSKTKEIIFDQTQFQAVLAQFDDSVFYGKQTSFKDARFSGSCKGSLKRVKFLSTIRTNFADCDFGQTAFQDADLSTLTEDSPRHPLKAGENYKYAVRWTNGTYLEHADSLEHAILLQRHAAVKELQINADEMENASELFELLDKDGDKSVSESELSLWRDELESEYEAKIAANRKGTMKFPAKAVRFKVDKELRHKLGLCEAMEHHIINKENATGNMFFAPGEEAPETNKQTFNFKEFCKVGLGKTEAKADLLQELRGKKLLEQEERENRQRAVLMIKSKTDESKSTEDDMTMGKSSQIEGIWRKAENTEDRFDRDYTCPDQQFDKYDQVQAGSSMMGLFAGGLALGGMGGAGGYFAAIAGVDVEEENTRVYVGTGLGAGLGFALGAFYLTDKMKEQYYAYKAKGAILHQHEDQINHCMTQLYRLQTFELTKLNWLAYVHTWEALYGYLDFLESKVDDIDDSSWTSWKKGFGACFAKPSTVKARLSTYYTEKEEEIAEEEDDAAATWWTKKMRKLGQTKKRQLGNKRLVHVLRTILHKGIDVPRRKNTDDQVIHCWENPKHTLKAFETIRHCFTNGPPPPSVIGALGDMSSGLQTADYLALMNELRAELGTIRAIFEAKAKVSTMTSNLFLSLAIAVAGTAADIISEKYIDPQTDRITNSSNYNFG